MSVPDAGKELLSDEMKKEDEGEEESVIKPAYSMTDMLDALSDEDDIYLEAEDGTVKNEETLVKTDSLNPSNNNFETSSHDIGKVYTEKSQQINDNNSKVQQNEININTNGSNDPEKILDDYSKIESEDKEIKGKKDLTQIENEIDEQVNVNNEIACQTGSIHQPVVQTRLTSDICGRFQVDGVQYENFENSGNSQSSKEESLPVNTEGDAVSSQVLRKQNSVSSKTSHGDPKYENIYDEVPGNQMSDTQENNRVSGEIGTKSDINVVSECVVLHEAKNSKSVVLMNSSSTVQNQDTLNTAPVSNVSSNVACSFPQSPSIADRIASLNTKTALTNEKSINNSKQVSSCVSVALPVSHRISAFGDSLGNSTVEYVQSSRKEWLQNKVLHNGNSLKVDSKQENDTQREYLDQAVEKEPNDNSSQLGDSISDESFKTEAVAGSDPFANMSSKEEKRTEKVTLPEKVRTRDDDKVAAGNDSKDSSVQKDITRMVDNDVYGMADSLSSEQEFKQNKDPMKQVHPDSPQFEKCQHYQIYGKNNTRIVDNDVYETSESFTQELETKQNNYPFKPVDPDLSQLQEHKHYQYMWQSSSLKGSSENIQDEKTNTMKEEWTKLHYDELSAQGSFHEKEEKGTYYKTKKNTGKHKSISRYQENFDESSYELHDPNVPWKSKMVLELQEENHNLLMERSVSKKDRSHTTTDKTIPDTEEFPMDQIYENVSYLNQGAYGGNTNNESVEYVDEVEEYDDGWSSSEFESYENTPSNTLDLSGASQNTQSIRRKKVGSGSHHQKHGGIKTSFKSPRSSDIQQMITRLGDRIGDKIEKVGNRLSKQEYEETEIEEEEPILMDISLNLEKHPPAELPTMPYGLNELQVKRRHIISSIVESETSYLNSLKRIVEDYEKPLQNAKPHILQKETIRVIFCKVKDILQCHHMFHIELSEAVKTWDKDEKIGNVFIASFSKIMVFESYSAFVNNFSVAMETTKKQARSRPAFAEFLKQNLEDSRDKLSLFGLMVKPVQRFPQFIMLLQDLLKHTPPDHHDRINLQMALTELENLTHKLNETKRESESRYDARKIISHTVGRNSVKNDDKRYLVRQEDVLYLDVVNGECKPKNRRVYLMNDIVLCVSVDHKDGDVAEKYKYKWHLPVEQAEVGDPSVAPSYQVRSGQGKTTVTPIKAAVDLLSHNPLRKSFRKSKIVDTENSKDSAAVLNPNNPHKQEVDDMLHDLPIIEQVGQLIGQLRMKYEGLNCTIINGLMRSLQVNIQQKSDVDKCIVQLSLPSSKGQEHKKYTFQLETSNRRRDWLFELQVTKMSLEPKNKPGWLIPENERKFNTKMPLFMRPLLIDVTQHDTRTARPPNMILPLKEEVVIILKMKMGSRKKKFKFKVECAVPVILPSPELPGVGVQHLWVCSGDRGRGHVTIVSLHGNQPQVVESFKSCDSPILCAELVPGYACCDDTRSFAQDTVWMALENQSLHVRSVSEEHREEPLLTLPLDSQVMCMKYLDSRLYIGLKSGNLLIYSRDQDGVWHVSNKEVLKLGSEPVTDLLPVDHSVWVACGRTVIVLHVVSHYHARGVKLQIEKEMHNISHAGETFVQSIIKAGAGLVVSFRGSSLLRLYHQETMQHLQDVNVASVLNELIDDKKKISKDMRESFRKLHVTCLMACKGLLWIGTSVGCVLSLPLPRLEGVPQIKGRPSVSYHAHIGPIKFLSSIYCGANQLHKPEIEESTVSDIYPHSEDSEDLLSGHFRSPTSNGITLAGVTESETDDYRGFTQSAEVASAPRALDDMEIPGTVGGLGAGLAASKNFWVSTPDLRVSQAISPKEDIHTLYGSLLKIPHEDYDAELLGMKHKSHYKKGAIPGLSLVTKKATAVNARFKQMMSDSSSPQSKYATLPVLLEDSQVSDTSNKTSLVDSESVSSASDMDNFLNVPSSQDDSANVMSSSSQQVLEKGCNHNAKHDLHNQQNKNKPCYISQSPPLAMLNNSVLGKSHMVVSGGEGHINWSEAKPLEMKYEDLCLLLWQYRQ